MDNDLQNFPPSIPAPPPVPLQEYNAPKFWNRRGFKTAVSVASIVITTAVCISLYARANNFGQQVVEAHPVDAKIVFTNAPKYLDPQIVSALLQEAYQISEQDDDHYDRARNPQDGTILREMANLYTGTTVDESGQVKSRQALGFNAWIKSITAVRRDVAKDKSIQTIQLSAEWRSPIAWLYANDAFYLIDGEGIRLPGEYKAQDRRGSKLLVIAGMEMPQDQSGQAVVPQPGAGWYAHFNHTSPDLDAGLKLAQLLAGQPFASQINGIDVSNMSGRRDPLSPWIVLQTLYTTDQGVPHLVQWGRPIGEEKFYEVKAAVKLKNLKEIYQHFSRIDAGRDYVDIRTEVILLPKPLASGQ